ncbi:MAG: hypothetical protein ACR2GT_04760 [Gaiellaceae bacterium]
MRRALAWIAGGLGVAALLRLRRRPEALEAPAADPAAELRRKLAEARDAGDDRDEFDAAEGTPVDEVEGSRQSLEERRAAIHAKAQEALGEMDAPKEP